MVDCCVRVTPRHSRRRHCFVLPLKCQRRTLAVMTRFPRTQERRVTKTFSKFSGVGSESHILRRPAHSSRPQTSRRRDPSQNEEPSSRAQEDARAKKRRPARDRQRTVHHRDARARWKPKPQVRAIPPQRRYQIEGQYDSHGARERAQTTRGEGQRGRGICFYWRLMWECPTAQLGDGSTTGQPHKGKK